MALPLIGLAAGLIGAAGKLFGRGDANRRLDTIRKENLGFAGQRKGLADTLLNARMPSALNAERNIYQNQANIVGNAQKSATSGNDLLLAGNAAQGQTNQAFNNLADVEANDYQRRYQNVDNANENMQEAMYADDNMRAAQQENRQNTWGDISNLGFGLASFGLNGGMEKLFPKKQTVLPTRF